MSPRKVRRPKKLGGAQCSRCHKVVAYEQLQYRTQTDPRSRALLCDDCAERRVGLGVR